MPTRLLILVLAPCAGLTTTLLSRSPLVITVDDLLPPATVRALRRTLAAEADLAPTGDYQEDVFAADAEAIEDARLRAIVQRAGVEAPVPDASALEAFLGAYTTDPSRFASDDVLAAAAMIKRREAKAAWDSEAGRRLLALNPGFETAARRRAMPDAERGALARTVVPRVLSDRARWTVEDATVVRYAAGESQVPHVDPSDATLLSCTCPTRALTAAAEARCSRSATGSASPRGAGAACSSSRALRPVSPKKPSRRPIRGRCTSATPVSYTHLTLPTKA